ncbi:NAD(+)/NADH kinase [Conexibacter sp. JD483]|uniref:ATP-NAD kinase family protein n=1 Tax=unclassified Conexibacter TaxID=2627773 RepID=UPI00271DD40C|nr:MULTISPECIES: NAD(+)/NADH kinase [unclassified Conexibacter]MDO8185276.1 NAD(+)/NADH kinase [Conexibacter sp. CPCC 205706]MDO8198322.1 NAD(+)/NADH kinase [Conexibacter sp. CPCC 205762]MDR9367717.1 NAD(+)/NADH kinase [Conexibacter sp. JD483]
MRLGLVVNPIAGMGGRVGLKGTDGPELLRRALERGATPAAPARAARALERIEQRLGGAVQLLQHDGPDSPAGTRAAARALAQARVDLLLFAGGDGTARDLLAALQELPQEQRPPLLGIPAGVKMHSACFAATPEAAGEVAAAFLRDGARARTIEAEIADRAERDNDDATTRRRGPAAIARHDADAPGRHASDVVLHGTVRVPLAPASVLGRKGGRAPASDAALAGACARIADELRTAPPGTLTLVGPGTTTARVLRELELDATPLGVDVVRDGALVARDASEQELLALLDAHAACVAAALAHDAAAPLPAGPRLLLGVVGGQGALLGRGNQQLSPAVLRRIPREAITVVADRAKLLALDPLLLHVDTGDPRLDQDLGGHLRVRVGPRESLLAEIAA